MPNYCDNTLTVSGEPQVLREFKHAVRAVEVDPYTGRRPVLDFDRLVPMPSELLENRAEVQPGCVPGWYSWRVENWGTKWNAQAPRLSGTLKSGDLRYRFLTAWTPPYEWLQTVAPTYPSLTFHLRYQEEMGHFEGDARWEGGKLVVDEAWDRT
jgi:hypothetical protein